MEAVVTILPITAVVYFLPNGFRRFLSASLSGYPSSQFIRLLNQSRHSLLPSLNFIEESGSRSDLATSKRCPELKGVQQRAEFSLNIQ